MGTRALSQPPWFRIAVQAMVVLTETDQHCPSAVIAQDVDAHAVHMRRVLAQLARCQLVVAREGRDGGYRLARDASQITLADIYRAVRSVDEHQDEPHACGSARIHRVLDGMEAEFEVFALARFADMSLADVIAKADALRATLATDQVE